MALDVKRFFGEGICHYVNRVIQVEEVWGRTLSKPLNREVYCKTICPKRHLLNSVDSDALSKPIKANFQNKGLEGDEKDRWMYDVVSCPVAEAVK